MVSPSPEYPTVRLLVQPLLRYEPLLVKIGVKWVVPVEFTAAFVVDRDTELLHNLWSIAIAESVVEKTRVPHVVCLLGIRMNRGDGSTYVVVIVKYDIAVRGKVGLGISGALELFRKLNV